MDFPTVPEKLFDELVLPEPWYWDWDRAIDVWQWPGINNRDAQYRQHNSCEQREAYGWIVNPIFGKRYKLCGNFPPVEFDDLEEAIRFCYLHVMLGVPHEKS